MTFSWRCYIPFHSTWDHTHPCLSSQCCKRGPLCLASTIRSFHSFLYLIYWYHDSHRESQLCGLCDSSLESSWWTPGHLPGKKHHHHHHHLHRHCDHHHHHHHYHHHHQWWFTIIITIIITVGILRFLLWTLSRPLLVDRTLVAALYFSCR